MKTKKIFKKVLALLCFVTLLAGGVLGYVTNSKAADATSVPAELKDYTRITMESFGLTASTDEAGTLYENAAEGIYTGTTLDKTYLDVDVNFNGSTGAGYFQYLYESDWKQYMRATHYGSGLKVVEGADADNNNLWLESVANNKFFNLKLAVDMKANASDDTKLDITMQVWIDNVLQGTLSFTASAGVLKQIYTSAGMTYRTPVIKENVEPENPVVIGDPVYPNVPAELEGYTKLSTESFGIAEEVIHTYNSASIWQPYSASEVTSLDNTYLDVDVSIKDVENTANGIFYAGTNFYIVIGWGQFRVYDTNLEVIYYDVALANFYILSEDYFNLKIATDIEGSQVTLRIWINNQLVMEKVGEGQEPTGSVTIEASNLIAQMNVNMNTAGTIKIAKSVEDMVVHYSDISSFRAETGHTAPETPEGYLFAGWYTDEACTIENAVAVDVMGDAAYAKFVDARVLTVKAQITAGTTANSEKTNIRFVTSVNDKNYSKIGFKISYTKADGTPKDLDKVDDIVYKQLTAMVGDEIWNYTPQGLICANATFFKAQILKGITDADFDTPINVTPYCETLDGTVVKGTTETKTVRQGIK